MGFAYFGPGIDVETSDGRNCVLKEDVTYVTKRGERIDIPAGSMTDGASTPRIAWRFLPPFGNYWLAAIFHDYLYRYTLRAKKQCDKLFLEAMESCGVSRTRRLVIYWSVRLFGGAAFKSCRNKQKEREQ